MSSHVSQISSERGMRRQTRKGNARINRYRVDCKVMGERGASDSGETLSIGKARVPCLPQECHPATEVCQASAGARFHLGGGQRAARAESRLGASFTRVVPQGEARIVNHQHTDKHPRAMKRVLIELKDSRAVKRRFWRVPNSRKLCRIGILIGAKGLAPETVSMKVRRQPFR